MSRRQRGQSECQLGSGQRRQELLLEPPVNDGTRTAPVALDPATRPRFVRALAELVLDRILQPNGHTE
jgi:hypothetical protein